MASFWIADPGILVASDLAAKAKVEPHHRECDRKGKKTEGEKFKDYFDYNGALHKLPSHRILALFRGEKEEILELQILPDAQIPVANVYGIEVYHTLLREIGFVESLIQPIGQDVFQGFCRHIASQAYLSRYPLIVQPFFALGARCLRLAYERKWIDYVLVRAAKP